MPGNEKTLYILKYLWENTDEDHQVTTNGIVEGLREYDISVNRHAIPSIIEQLQNFGIDVICTKGSPNKYFIGQRYFELSELKLLVDAVESSKFISSKRSDELVKRLCGMASTYQAKDLNRNLYVEGRVKTDNNKLLYTIDILHRAINDNRRITFKYVEYTAVKEKKYKHNGYLYEVSPYVLLWNNDCYYVVGYSAKHQGIAKFRIDRIEDISVTEKTGIKRPADFDPRRYMTNVFSMYDGVMEEITLKCDEDMMKVIIDKFGNNVSTIISEDKKFIVRVPVSVSPTFYGWLFGFCGKIQIVSPQHVVDEYVSIANNVLQSYDICDSVI